jgi:hypothetical protein
MYTTSHSASSVVASSTTSVALGRDSIVDLSGRPVLGAILTVVAMFEMVDDSEVVVVLLLLLAAELAEGGEEEEAPLYAFRIAS